MSANLSGKVALLTGAGREVGEALALFLARQGVSLALQDLSPLNLDRLAGQITEAGGQARTYLFDIAKGMPAQALVEQVLSDCGRLDFVVHCAAVDQAQELLRLDEWDWHRTLDLNLTAAYLLLRALGGLAPTPEGRRMVNVAVRPAVASKRGGAATLASLGGLLALTRQAAGELSGSGLVVCAVCAGFGEQPSSQPAAALFERSALVLQALLAASPLAVNGMVIDLEAPGQAEPWLQHPKEDSTEVKDERTHNDPG